jgi:LPXTG-motif cell wall-anchored protein
MSTQVIIFTLIGAIVILVAVAAWLFDAKRNKHVAEDEERVEQPRKRS